jgi:hypothetical protein
LVESTTLFETVFHIPVVVEAIDPIAPTIAMTIKDTINPYSTAVAPFWHFAMPRISSNMIGPVSLVGCERVPFSQKSVNKNFPRKA